MPNKSADSVDAPCLAYGRMAEKWRLIEDLLGGTQAMRDAGERWLPYETKEKPLDYKCRLGRSILYAALADTIDKTASRPFSRAITLQGAETLPEQLLEIEEDADLSGCALTPFGRSLYVDGLAYGKAHILVDYPSVSAPMTLLQEQSSGVRPYFCRICPPDLIAWVSDKGGNGEDELTQVRIREKRVEPLGMFGEEEVEYVRVLYPDRWELWRKGDGWSIVEEGANSLGEIPLVTIYFNRTGMLTADPTFEDLAWLNLAHWQSYSDQRNLLRVARVPILCATGLSKQEYDQGIVVGASNLFKSTNVDAKLFYVEATGSALAEGANDLKTLEERMEVLGLQPLISRSGGVTATAKSMDEARSESNILSWVRETEAGLRKAYEYAARWIKTELPEDFKVDIYSDFGLSLQTAEDMQTLLALYGQGVITAETLLTEVKRRGVLSEMVDSETEAQAARDAVPAGMLTALGQGAEPPADDEEEDDEEPDAAA